jgi:hypothetical protein
MPSEDFLETIAFISREIEMELIIPAVTTATILSCDTVARFPA